MAATPPKTLPLTGNQPRVVKVEKLVASRLITIRSFIQWSKRVCIPSCLFLMYDLMKKYIIKPLAVTTKCGNFMIFLSFRFYVKSIFKNLEVLKLLFLLFLMPSILFFGKIQPSKSAKFHKNQNSEPINVLLNGRFCTSRSPKIDFT